MKVALCLSGQMRFVEECYPYIYGNLIKKNDDVDVFIHSWYSEEMCDQVYKYGGDGGWQHQRIKKGIDKIAVELYQPKAFKFEPPKTFRNSSINMEKSIDTFFPGGKSEPDFRNRQVNNMYSMWYSILQSNMLKQEYALANDIKYDAVIRCRFDNEVKSIIKCDSLDLNRLHYLELYQPSPLISDWIGISNDEIMNVYSSVFNYFDFFVKSGDLYCNELFLSKIMEKFNISIHSHHEWNITLPRF